MHKGEKGTTKIWNLTFNELPGHPWTGIYNKKNDFIESMFQHIQALKARGYPVLIMRQDDAGENKTLEKRLHKTEYTAADTPKQNTLAE